MKAKKEPWCRFRHRVVSVLLRPVVWLLCWLKYGISPERFRQQGKRAYLILYNHQTPLDQFFVGLSFRRPVYYLATEDIFSMGWVSKLISWLVAPIPIAKATGDMAAVKTCIRVAREGGTIAIAPEGNRTYSGRTGHMADSIAPLARKLGLPIALYRIEGGYGVEPRWSDKPRRGRMRSYVSRVMEPEEYAAWTDAELFAQIKDGLFVDEGCDNVRYRSKRRAEFLERAMYVCPRCGLSELESEGNRIRCRRCGLTAEYGEDKRLTAIGADFPYPYVGQWYDAQCDFVRRLDPAEYRAQPAFTDTVQLYEVALRKNKTLLRSGARMALYGDRITIDENAASALALPFDELTAAAVLGRNKLNLYTRETVYQITGSKRFNALKYVNFYYHYQNRGNANGEFLGL